MDRRLFCVIAVSRSGHHAIMNWICEQYPENINSWNRMMFDGNKKVKKREGMYPKKNAVFYVKNPNEISSMYNYENFNLKNLDMIKNAPQLEGFERTDHILMIRDFYNLVASSLKKGASRYTLFTQGKNKKSESFSEIWKGHVQEAIGGEKGMLTISYNKWFVDKEYRESLCEQLDIPFTDQGKNIVPHNAKGSSFNGKKFQNKAEEMSVLSRYESMMDDPRFMKIVSADKEIIELNEQYFGIKFPYSKSPEEVQEESSAILEEERKSNTDFYNRNK
jgi:hypothetical protein